MKNIFGRSILAHKKGISDVLHISILLMCLFLVISISLDTFKGISFYEQSYYLKVQFWICLWFLFCFLLEFLMADSKWKYFRSHFLFLLVSIPYQSIITHYQWTFDTEFTYFIRFIPLLRGGYALAIVVGWFTNNKISSLFISYVLMLVANVYFASLAFFALEVHVNPAVKDYQDALWWASMNVTTVGSNIYAVTATGRILSVFLAGLGMLMFPILTVYVTNLLLGKKPSGASKKSNPTPAKTANAENADNSK